MGKIPSLLVVLPSMVVGGLLTAALTTTARAKDPAPKIVHDYKVVHEERDLVAAGKEGYEIRDIKMTDNGFMIWTMER